MDTGKLEVAQGFEAQMNASNICRSPVATGTLPCLQVNPDGSGMFKCTISY